MKVEGIDPARPVFTPPSDSSEVHIAPVEHDAASGEKHITTTPTPHTEAEMGKPSTGRRISRKELKEHDKKTPWFVVEGEVYDGTAFLYEHPVVTTPFCL